MTANQQQSEAWNGAEAAHYIDHADRYDRQLAPLTDALLEHLALGSDEAVLDVGCGCGATTLAAARLARSAIGADLSEPLTEVAARRALDEGLDNASFVIADAQLHDFGDGAFDVILSQFGVMFFDDPPAAFSNLYRSLAPSGRAAFVCWQGLEANEWVSIVGDAVTRHAELPALGSLAGGPGMFALKEPAEAAALLGAAGFTQVEITSLTPSILLGGGGTLEEATAFLLGTGIARGLLGRLEGGALAEATDEVRSVLSDRFEPGTGVRLGAAAWLIAADG